MKRMFESILCQVPQYGSEVIEPLIELAVEIAREGREGRRIGTIFMVGDEEQVLARSRPLILDPLFGHPEAARSISDANLRGTIKELAQLDGAFVVSNAGVFLSACRYLDAAGTGVVIQLGLGSRHLAAANMSSVTGAVGIVVSESATVRIFCHGKMLAEVIPELWLMSRRKAELDGQMVRESADGLAVITPKPAARPAAQKVSVPRLGGAD